MNLDNITNLVSNTISNAYDYSKKIQVDIHQEILLKSFISSNEFFTQFISDFNIDSIFLEKQINNKHKIHSEPKLSNDSIKWFGQANLVRERLNDEYLSTEHFILSIMNTDIKKYIKNININEIEDKIMSIRENSNSNSSNAENTYKSLEKYSRNLVEEAKSGKTDPIIGRSDEINSIVRILSRKTKNNPVLIGDPGVGKTAVIEGLAQRISQNDVPDNLKGKKLLELSLSSLIAGAKYKGEFEERVQSIIKEVKNSDGEIILFIDEIHTIVGAGKSEGSMDISNMIKPLLARGELRLIGATTLNEYREYIEKDGALERRFQKIIVQEPSIEDTISIIRGLKERFEIYHGVNITDKAIVSAVELSTRYIGDRKLPDKAIDLIDEACSMIQSQVGSMPVELDNKKREKVKYKIELNSLKNENDDNSKLRKEEIKKIINDLNEEEKILNRKWINQKNLNEKKVSSKTKLEKAKLDYKNAESIYDYESMAKLKNSTIPLLENELKELENKIKSIDSLIDETVREENIKTVISKWTNIPLEKLNESEKEKIINLKSYLSKTVIGQDDAIETVSNTIIRSYAGINDPNKPLGSFLFLGPTGVGKTELVKSLAHELFDNDSSIIRIDMSEYMEKHNVSRLIGAPPGYIGYEQGGQLTEQVRRNPYSIVLLDEIEKAHTDVFNILLQILDEGSITDSLGNNINFKNTIIVMTSNIASDKILNGKLESNEIDIEIRKYFKPEILNRIDEIITFNSLNNDVIKKIIDKFIYQLNIRLSSKNTNVILTENAIKMILENGSNNNYGARPIKRYIQKNIETLISYKLFEDEYNSQLIIDVENDKFIIK